MSRCVWPHKTEALCEHLKTVSLYPVQVTFAGGRSRRNEYRGDGCIIRKTQFSHPLKAFRQHPINKWSAVELKRAYHASGICTSSLIEGRSGPKELDL